MKKTLIIFLLLMAVAGSSAAQHKPSFVEIDTATYRAYLHKNWGRIIEVGKQGLANNIDYYYLRIRIGYAYYMKKQYRQAIPYYRAALKFSSKDAIAMEYLYRSYLYGGRYQDAQKLVRRFSPPLKEYLGLTGRNPISEISFFGTYGTGATAAQKQTLNLAEAQPADGSQILPNSFTNYNLNLSHEVVPGIIFHHALNLLRKDEYSMAVLGGTPYLSESQVVRQFTYRLAVDITPTPGLTLTPAVTYVNYRIPIFNEYGAGMGRGRAVYRYDTHQEGGASLKITKQAGPLSISIAGGYTYLNLSDQITGAGALTFYPLGNLNLYVNATGYYHRQSQNGQTLNQVIQSYKLGFKVMKNLWIEGYTLVGDFSNFQDPYSGITYNSQELYHAIYSASIYVPFGDNKVSVFAGYRNYNSVSSFVPVDHIFEGNNHISFNYQTFTGGIIWKL
jgi:hypothetical protein